MDKLMAQHAFAYIIPVGGKYQTKQSYRYKIPTSRYNPCLYHFSSYRHTIDNLLSHIKYNVFIINFNP